MTRRLGTLLTVLKSESESAGRRKVYYSWNCSDIRGSALLMDEMSIHPKKSSSGRAHFFSSKWTIYSVFATTYPEILSGVGEYKTFGK